MIEIAFLVQILRAIGGIALLFMVFFGLGMLARLVNTLRRMDERLERIEKLIGNERE